MGKNRPIFSVVSVVIYFGYKFIISIICYQGLPLPFNVFFETNKITRDYICATDDILVKPGTCCFQKYRILNYQLF